MSEALTLAKNATLDDALAVSMTPESRDGVGMSVLPKNIAALRRRDDWADGVLPGIQKELTGLRDKGVFEVIPCPAGREYEVIPTFGICRAEFTEIKIPREFLFIPYSMRIFTTKSNPTPVFLVKTHIA